MKIVEKIDLTQQPSSCLQHPLVKLKNIIEKLNTGEAVEVSTNSEIIPVEAVEIIAKKKNLSLEIVESNKPFYKILLVKKQ